MACSLGVGEFNICSGILVSLSTIWNGYNRTTQAVLMDSNTAKVAREVAANESMLMREPAPDSKAPNRAFISSACPLLPENEVVDFFRPRAQSSFVKFHMRAVF